jgi:uncharacterized membrane protein
MSKGRLEAFSDGVIAIIITIMVLELKVPHGRDLAALGPVVPNLLSYLLSFVLLGTYWNNHHHLFQATQHVSGPVLWANLHLLFWLSLVPFATGWMGEGFPAPWPAAAYGAVQLLAAFAYYILVRVLIRRHGEGSVLAKAHGRDLKGKTSVALYTAAIPLAFVHASISCGLFVVVAILWLIPDRRIEKALGS